MIIRSLAAPGNREESWRTKRAFGKSFLDSPSLFLYSSLSPGSPSGRRKHKASVKPSKGLITDMSNRLCERQVDIPQEPVNVRSLPTKASKPEADAQEEGKRELVSFVAIEGLSF